MRYLISILIGGILLLIFKDWLGISRKHPPRKKAAHQPDATSEHEPETIPPSTSNVHQPTIIAQSAPNEHGQSIPDEHKPAVAAQPLLDDHKTVKKDQSRPVLVSEPDSHKVFHMKTALTTLLSKISWPQTATALLNSKTFRRRLKLSV